MCFYNGEEMKEYIQKIKKYFSKFEKLPQGFYMFHSLPDEPLQYRLHLRIEPTGCGVLIVNASTVLHLNQTATEFAYGIIQRKSDEEIIKEVNKRYSIDKNQLEKDFISFCEQLLTLINMPDLDPISYLGMEREPVYSCIQAPYRLDCALTYRVNSSDLAVAPQDRASRELSTEEWKHVIKKAFDAGIPHLIFTGGEPTLRDDLFNLLNYCEELGLVTGLVTDGKKLIDPNYLNKLLESGLDHLMLVSDPRDEKTWSSLEQILTEDIFTTMHLTLNAGDNLHPYLDKLADLKVNAVSLSSSNSDLENELNKLENYCAIKQIELVWDIPVPYSHLNPIALELEPEEKRDGAGSAWLYVEPDGDVLPAQGINRVLGNFLNQAWDDIWQEQSKRTIE